MAKRTDAPAPAPNYGAHKPQVIAFLRELLMKGHKPQAEIAVWPANGETFLGIRCVHCLAYIKVPIEGAIDVPWCAPCAKEEGARR